MAIGSARKLPCVVLSRVADFAEFDISAQWAHVNHFPLLFFFLIIFSTGVSYCAVGSTRSVKLCPNPTTAAFSLLGKKDFPEANCFGGKYANLGGGLKKQDFKEMFMVSIKATAKCLRCFSPPNKNLFRN